MEHKLLKNLNLPSDLKKLDEKEEADRLQAQATRTSTKNDDITSENVDNLEEKSNNLLKEGEDSEIKEKIKGNLRLYKDLPATMEISFGTPNPCPTKNRIKSMA